MISRRIIAAFALLWAFPCLAQTGSVKTPSQLNSEINTTLPNNTVGQITPAGLRQVALDQVASVPFLNVTNVFGASQSFPNGVTISGGTITGAAISGGTITGLPTPINPSDAVTLAFVNAAVTTGINILAPSRLATAAILPNTPTYSNGTAGVGATLTAGSNSTLTVDGVVANLNDIVLVKNQVSAFQNGIYTLTTAGSGSAAWVLTRVSYFNIASQMKVGSYTFITAGTANANSAYTLQSTVVTVGTDALTWALFSSTGTAVTSLDGTNGNISVQTGSLKVVSGQLSGNVLSSRAFAQMQNLSSFNSIQTLGYAAGGDGGGAMFKNVGTSAFKDTYIKTGTIAAGSGYTNGSYLGVPFTGGSSNGCAGSVTVSGGVVTVVNIGIPCAGYAVGDTLVTPNTFIGGTGSGFSFTVSSISTVTASFIDSSGAHWQFVPEGRANASQFGCKGDWNGNGSDGSSTNNLNCLQNAAAWASPPNSGASVAGQGNTVFIPKGAYMTCGTFNNNGIFSLSIPQSVSFEGAGQNATILTECAVDPAVTQYVELCDIFAAVGQFGCKVSNLSLSALQITTSTLSAAMIHSVSGQQFALAENVEVDGGFKGCIKYELGRGGAANDIWIGIDCIQFSGAVNPGYSFNSSNTQHILQRSVVASTGTATTGIANLNGKMQVDGLDVEGYGIGLSQNVTNAGDISVYRNVQQNSNGCSAAIQLVSGNIPGNILFENVSTSCPTTISNGQSGGTNFTGNIVKPITCVSGACN